MNSYFAAWLFGVNKFTGGLLLYRYNFPTCAGFPPKKWKQREKKPRKLQSLLSCGERRRKQKKVSPWFPGSLCREEEKINHIFLYVYGLAYTCFQATKSELPTTHVFPDVGERLFFSPSTVQQTSFAVAEVSCSDIWVIRGRQLRGGNRKLPPEKKEQQPLRLPYVYSK